MARRWEALDTPAVDRTPEQALELACALAAAARAVRPDWPTPADRAEDYAAHVALVEKLRIHERRRGHPR